MGQAGSRAAVRASPSGKTIRKYPTPAPQSYQATEQPGLSVGETTGTETDVAASAVNSTSEHKDSGSVSLMNRLVAGVVNRPVDVHDRQGTPKRRTFAERESGLDGRISAGLLLEILQAHREAQSAGSTLNIPELASRHGVDAETLHHTLTYLAMPQTYIAQQQEPKGLE